MQKKTLAESIILKVKSFEQKKPLISNNIHKISKLTGMKNRIQMVGPLISKSPKFKNWNHEIINKNFKRKSSHQEDESNIFEYV